jgi:subtilisin family serine protease
MNPLDLVKLSPVMELATGRPEIVVGLIDGPVTTNHPDLTDGNIRVMPGKLAGFCVQDGDSACLHGTFVAGILCARRRAIAPAICPDCTLLVRPIFAESMSSVGQMPSATPEELADAITETIDAGAAVINLSAAVVQPSARGERQLQEALDYAARREVIVVAAAGNQASVGSSCITRHPWVIPVAACDLQGRPLNYTNLGVSIGTRGLSAPGEDIMSLGANGDAPTFSGTSAAAPFVTGAVALLFSVFPNATPVEVKLAVSQAYVRRRAVVPPLLDAWGAYQFMAANHGRR